MRHVRTAAGRQLVLGLLPVLAMGLMSGLIFGLAGGLAVGLAFGIWRGTEATAERFRFRVAMLVAARSRRLPFRIASFLDWAYDAGLLRLSGITIQFGCGSFGRTPQ